MFHFFLISVLLIWTNTADQHELVVGDTFNTGVDGQMFMIEAGAKDVTIDSFTFSFNGGGTTEYSFKVWYKQGSFVDYRLDESHWTEACSGSAPAGTWDSTNGVWVGPNTGKCSISIPSGHKYSIYIAGISRGCVTKKICSGSSCTQTFDDQLVSDNYLTVYMGLGLHDTFGNGYGNTYFVHPDVTIFYSVNGTPSPTPQPTEAFCCIARKNQAIWNTICGAMEIKTTCNKIYDQNGKKRCQYQVCGTVHELISSEEQEMVIMKNINQTFDAASNGYRYHWMLLYAFLVTVVTMLAIFIYRCCKESKPLNGISPLLTYNSV